MKLLLLSLSLTYGLLAQDPFQVKVGGHGQAMIVIPGLSSFGDTWDTTVARVLGTWIGYSQYTDRGRTEANLRRQYAKLAGVEMQITGTARHFIMWDDPDWMFGHVDRFLGVAKPGPVR